MINSEFDQWNTLKKDIQEHIGEGCVYWVSIGQNIGYEVCGKGPEFKRPVLVLKRIYIPNFAKAFIGIPLTTKNKYYNFLSCKLTNTRTNQKVFAMLGQIKTFDNRRIISYYYKVKREEMEKIRQKLYNFLSPSS